MIDLSHPSTCRARPLPARAAGFTLIELLITVAIIGILAAIAYPSYGQYVKKARRSDGHLALLEQRQAIERCRATSYTYAGCALTSTTSPEGFYNITMAAPTANAFTIVATATGAQANDADCVKLTVDERDRTLGFKTGDVANADCW